MSEASKEIVEVLKRVRVRLSDPKAWTRGQLARDRQGNPVSERSSAAICWCVYGAVSREAMFSPVTTEEPCERLMAFVHKRSSRRWIGGVNDSRRTTHAHILKWLDTVIEHDSKLLGLK